MAGILTMPAEPSFNCFPGWIFFLVLQSVDETGDGVMEYGLQYPGRWKNTSREWAREIANKYEPLSFLPISLTIGLEVIRWALLFCMLTLIS